SKEQKFAAEPPQWHSPAFAELIGHPPLIAQLRRTLGDEIVFMLGHYIISGPGVPGLALHSDYQPFGSPQKGWEESSPATLRVLIYMDDLTLEKAPFTIVPRSHASLHQVANPYMRYDHHPDMVTITLRAGDAILFNVKAFHGTHPHLGNESRGMLELAYRPAWARCAGPVKEWDSANVAAAPDIAKPFLLPRNGGEAESALGTTLDARSGDFGGLMPPALTPIVGAVA
ncbi:MAG: phytanoyl-CoA dioxygenase family protein, partial [Sphingobium sp.]